MKRIDVITLKQVRTRTAMVNSKHITSPNIAAEIIQQTFDLESEAVEHFGILTLNTKHQVAGAHILSVGTVNATIAQAREVFKAALMNNAISVILFHNHPSGDVTPSQEDIAMTNQMEGAGKLLNIEVLDHIIIGYPGKYISFKEQGIL